MSQTLSHPSTETPEHRRLEETHKSGVPWKKWGPYLSERQWGTVREDYSDNGDAWDYFTHDQARSRAYRWGEDGLAGISDDKQRLCFALALWNGKDPILKERLFGLTNSEGNHGEDVKEYYFYLDSTPTHSYMKYLYKYPQAAYPYNDLLETNRRRTRNEFEYELLDTGIFDGDRYFDVFVEYAKGGPEDILVQITAANRGSEAAELHLLPTLWFRNDWALRPANPDEKPTLQQIEGPVGTTAVAVTHPVLGAYYLYCDGDVPLLFTENETNNERLFNQPNASPYVKDGINNYVVHDRQEAVNPDRHGTKVAAHYRLAVGPGESAIVRLRLSKQLAADRGVKLEGDPFPFGQAFADTLAVRLREADEFYASVIPSNLAEDAANVMRQALAGMLWSKQFYFYDVDRWLLERGFDPLRVTHKTQPRNNHWSHMYNGDILSMPDKWEYPWYAAWDLAFHALALSLVDLDFAKDQLGLMLSERYLHPNGQIPAYEWSFSDVNPPVHAWAVISLYRIEKLKHGVGDVRWLKKCFRKLVMNFTWWVNRKDRTGRNVFEGGFLGLDNIGVFDRSKSLPTGGYLEQADGTAWMALFADNMLEITSELAMIDDDYADMVLKFLEHDAWITSSLVQVGGGGMWDEEDGFFYDVLRLPNGEVERLKVRSMVGLLPLCAATPFEPRLFDKLPQVTERFQRFMDARPELCAAFHDPTEVGVGGRRLFSVLDESKLRRVLKIMLDENEFLSPHGIRSLSRYHAEHPYVFRTGDHEYKVSYLPAESDAGMFGGNSNWRGPVWMPVNILILRALVNYYTYYGDALTVECPTGSGRRMNLYQVAEEIARRLVTIFLKDSNGRRPVHGGTRKFQEDPHWRDLVLFYEYFHGDNGAGIGASHQTGWTGIVARVLHTFATTTAQEVIELGVKAAIVETESAWSSDLKAG
ncbi:MAG TPA: glucosidase [Terriglobales bacterium]|nr:glucosidase [Terriglobales bacterium]